MSHKKFDCALALLSVLLISGVLTTFTREGNFFINSETKAATIFHGVNVVVKLAPFIPTVDSFDPMSSVSDVDIALMKKWGFNYVRLGVMWEGYETSKGVYNTQYLQDMNTLINKLGQSGIYTLVDLHQDALSRRTCGEGIPTFYTQNVDHTCWNDGIGFIAHLIGACKPMSELVKNYDANGLPLLSDCLKHPFGDYSQTPDAMSGFANLYKEGTELNTAYMNYWNNVAEFFKGNKFILGYDLINEPPTANIYKAPWLLRLTDKWALQPLYQKATEMIRAHDKQKMIFFETNQENVIPAFGGIPLNTGFSETPSKGETLEREIMVDHQYCCSVEGAACATEGGDPPLSIKDKCASYHYRKIKLRNQNAKDLETGVMYNEFGACSNSEACAAEITSVTESTDNFLMSWGYWMFKGFNDFTTAGDASKEGLFANPKHSASSSDGKFDPSNVQHTKLKALTRSYVQSYQGKPKSLLFRKDNASFASEFFLDLSLPKSTVYLNEEYHYPTGYKASLFVDGTHAATSGQNLNIASTIPMENYLEISCKPKDGDKSDLGQFLNGAVFASRPLDNTAVDKIVTEKFNPNGIDMKVQELGKDQNQSMVKFEIQQSDSSMNYSVQIFGLTDLNDPYQRNGSLQVLCALYSRSGNNMCAVPAYRLVRNSFVVSKKVTTFGVGNKELFRIEVEGLHGHTVVFLKANA